MSSFFGLFDDDDDVVKDVKDEDTGVLKLRKEELDVNKKTVQTGDVEIGKEIIEEKKTIDVPVAHEEVVIERRNIDNEIIDSPISDEESIHIPVSEEKVDVDKHTVITGEVAAHKRSIENVETIEETVKREEARIDSHGNPNIVSEEREYQHH